MPKAIKRYVKKKEGKEENIGETVADIRERLKERQRTLVYAVFVLAAVVLASGSFFIYSKVMTARSQDLEYEGLRLYYRTVQTQPASPADGYKSALEKFRASYAAKKRSTALFYVANCYYELGRYDDAVSTLKSLTGQYSDLKITPLAYYKMAMAYERKNDMTSALDTLNKLSSIKDSPLQDFALMESARVLEAAGKTEEAKSKYKELINKFPKSALADEARARLGS